MKYTVENEEHQRYIRRRVQNIVHPDKISGNENSGNENFKKAYYKVTEGNDAYFSLNGRNSYFLIDCEKKINNEKLREEEEIKQE